VALAPAHRFTRLKSISLEKVAAEPLIGFCRKDHPEYYVGLDRIFNPLGIKPSVVVECDSASSLITEVEAGRGIALTSLVFKYVSGKRLLYRSLAGINESVSVGIARAKNGDLAPAGEKFCEMLRKASKVANSRTTKAVEQNTYRERG
jgi:DNA-binding transcriptional LysR family regulator